MELAHIYGVLMEAYGPQGWWPLLHCRGTNPTKTGSLRGYHPGDYSYPHTAAERFEIAVGAVLAQNTAWPNAEQALQDLDRRGLLRPEALLRSPAADLGVAIRPAGYFNVKARKLRCLAEFWATLGGAAPTRPALLEIWGVGPETADCILLYAFSRAECVVDAYTRRVLQHLGLVGARWTYDEVKQFCSARLPCRVPVLQEFHALLVEHAKRCYRGAVPSDALLCPRSERVRRRPDRMPGGRRPR